MARRKRLSDYDEITWNSGSELEESDSDSEKYDDSEYLPDTGDDSNDDDISDTSVDEISHDTPSTSTKKRPSQPSSKKKTSAQPRHDFDWREDDNQPTLPVFEENCGVLADLTSDCTVLECFSLFFDDNLFKLIKKETNRYAATTIGALKRQQKLKPHSMWNKWVPVKLHEIKCFFAIVFHMCLLKKPNISDYWSTDPVLHSSFAGKLMSRDRFLSILSMLHLNDNNQYAPKNDPNHDPVFKIRPILDYFNKQSKASLSPDKELTVDEGMCPFRGRIGFRVYIKNKPHKYGLKLYILAEAKSGYVLNTELYSGAAAGHSNAVEPLIYRLCNNYLGKGYVIYMDRFYTSPSLLRKLRHDDTLGVGTVMKNRKGLCKQLVNTPLKKGEFSFRRSEELFFLKWKDTRDVFMLSSLHKNGATVLQTKAKGGHVMKAKPNVVVDYNLYKCGVDRGDQLQGYYPFARRTLKWWKKLFFHYLIMSAANAYLVYKRLQAQNSRLHFADFIRTVASSLADCATVERESSLPGPSCASRLTSKHFPSKIPATEKKERPTRVSKVCADTSKKNTGKKVRKETRWMCSSCSVALCLPECFRKYHSSRDYSV